MALRNLSVSLYDDIGNVYARKNTYLVQLAQLQSEVKQETGDKRRALKKAIADHQKTKKQHPYIIALSTFHKNEKLFLTELKKEAIDFKNGLPKGLPKKLVNLEMRLHCARTKVEFYKKSNTLCYDAQLAYQQNQLQVEHLPLIIENYKQEEKELLRAKQEVKRVDPKIELKAQEALKAFKIEQQALYAKGVQDLKQKRQAGLISVKAQQNSLVELKRKRKESIHIKSYSSQKKVLKELIANKRYLITKGIDRQEKILASNLSDNRRRTPSETERTMVIAAYLTALIPGLGQLINKQFFKALLFFIGTLFIYMIAIPYALGYGNYQGEGLKGLLTLAENGKKIDKSLIFMIEGVVALVLVIFALGIYYLSFKDVLTVEKQAIKGIRTRTWFETLVKIEQDGFPILVSVPAFIATVFIVLVPVTTTILLSFTGMDPQHQSKFGWVALENYKLIAMGQGLAGSVFWTILGWTLIWTLVSSTLAILTGFALAIIANNERIKGKAFFRMVYLLPWAVPAFITIMFFSIMLAPNGSITVLLEKYFNWQVNVKSDANLSRAFLILLQVWLGSSYVFLLSTGVLQAIPEDLYEAAQIDGATEWQKLKRITVPIVLFQTAPLLVGQYTFNFNNFSIIYLFNGGGPFNPSVYGNLAGSTDLLISYIYKLTLQNQYQAVGAAITIVISMGLMLFAFIGFKNSKAFKEERL